MEEDNEEVNSVVFQPVDNGDQTCQPKSIVLANIETLDTGTISTEQGADIEQMGQHVLGYLEMHPGRNVNQEATLYAQGLEFGTPRLFVTGEGESEIYVVVNSANSSDQTVAHIPEGALLNSSAVTSGNEEDKSESFSSTLDNSSVPSGNVSCIQVVNTPNESYNHTVLIEGEQFVEFKSNSAEFGSQPSVWTIDDGKLQEKEELIFFPDPSALTSNPEIATSLFQRHHSEKTANGNLMELARIAQEFQHASGSEGPVQNEQECSGGSVTNKSDVKVQQDQNVYDVRLQTSDNHLISDGGTEENNASSLNGAGKHSIRSNHSFSENISSSPSKEVNASEMSKLLDKNADGSSFTTKLKETSVSKTSTPENNNTDEVSSHINISVQNVAKLVSGDNDHKDYNEPLMRDKLKSASLRSHHSISSVSNEKIKETELKEDLRIINEVDSRIKNNLNEKCSSKKKESLLFGTTKEPTTEVTEAHINSNTQINLDSSSEKSVYEIPESNSGKDSYFQPCRGIKSSATNRYTSGHGKQNKAQKKKSIIEDKQCNKTLNENKNNPLSKDSTVGDEGICEQSSNVLCPAETSSTSMNFNDELLSEESPDVDGSRLTDEKSGVTPLTTPENGNQQALQEVENMDTDETASDLCTKSSLDSADTLVEPIMQPPKKTYTRKRIIKNTAKADDINLHYLTSRFPVAEVSTSDDEASDSVRDITNSPESSVLVSQPNELAYSPNCEVSEDPPSKKRKLTTNESENNAEKLNSQDSTSNFFKRKHTSGRHISAEDPSTPLDKNEISGKSDKKDSETSVAKTKSSIKDSLKVFRSGRKKTLAKKTVLQRGRISKPAAPSVEAKKLQNNLKKTLKSSQYDPSSEYVFTDSEESHELISYSSSAHPPKKTTQTPPKKPRGRPIGSRNRIVNNSETWNKLLKSCPSKIKTTRFLTKLQRRQARYASQVPPVQTEPKRQVTVPNSYEMPMAILAIKRAQKKGFQVHYIEQKEREKGPFSPVPYNCMLCQYDTERLDNFILHLKDCLITNANCNYNDVSDMNRRQMIRGEPQDDQESTFSTSSSSQQNAVCHNITSDQSSSQKNPDEEQSQTTVSVFRTDKEQELAEEDIVWVERKQGHWPAWVQEIDIDERMATIFYIDLPSRRNNSQKLDSKGLIAFHDAEVNKSILENAKSLPNKEIFIKAVQKAEEFVRKKKCLGVDIHAAEFFKSKFSGPRTDKQPNDAAENNENGLVDSHPCSSLFEGDSLKGLAEDVVKKIQEGTYDDYALDFYNNRIPSERQRRFFSHDVMEKKALMDQSWFGPIEESEKSELYNYLHQLLLKTGKFKDESFLIRYVYYVLCPEIIVKAISELKQITPDEAEDLFADDEVKEALKKYCP